jgi:DNA-directed RNA polymerase specialized sigma24 family protein
MSTKTLPVTAGSFEKFFAAIATKRTLDPRSRSGKIAKDLTDWRDIAWEALRRKKLGDTLLRAIETLAVKYREVLFLQDVKNLNTAETAWVLNITVGAVRYRLLRARMRVRDALASRLLPKLSQKNSDLANSYTHDMSCKIRGLTCQNSLSLA